MRYLKNTKIKTGSNAIQLPMSTSANGPTNPIDGQIRFNTTVNRVEFYYNTSWNQLANIGLVDIVVEQFDGSAFDGNNEVIMSQTVTSENDVMVFIGGVHQIPVVNYTVDTSTLHLISAPPTVDAYGNPNKIVVIHNLNSTNVAVA